ncbi:aminotransferase class III-fold pyridoxal phosphate-dependent enzyme [Tenggerimyces flavus]|uniref:Aminotransferase class III-fold pyridoxal phosphate-dependent enzyme n=1 Tax=Tenggerimyces flavus TaxID=1708749 RepID=A0ABV7YLI6_9ACTN|nr:aminotransferase class III-fold pyridoxal phosphate-dependent enzyme [Tenggerimyces flavus]MBM7784769.1 glutamate-1-semialdehyde 2,1-aminomutase [Tenggerimyces flavus]
MPWGSSTISKAPVLLPEEPEVIVRGNGCRIWDDQGREFIDFRNSLGPVTLGYRYPAVDEAIRRQLENGISFGHPHPLELEAAELICDLVPGAEQARFLKTGGEALAATIRMARAHTGRDHIVHIGYNGWLNALAPGGPVLPGRQATDLPGVPAAIAGLHHRASWNDAAGVDALLDEHEGQVAAIMVAADYATMALGADFYPQLRALADAAGALLIYDEIVTGFRIALGGAQEYFGVLPDLAVFSKGIANGMPISAYVGRRDVMAACGPGGVTVSSTFGGETLSLAAAIACMTTYRDHDVVQHLWDTGQRMWSGLNSIFTESGIPLQIKGFWPCPTFTTVDGTDAGQWLTPFVRMAFKHGVSLYTVPYVNFSHSAQDIDEALERLGKACAELSTTAR